MISDDTKFSRIACETGEISAYLDGELSPEAEIAFEMHTAGCAECRAELNLQKNLLRELDICLTTGELELPKDFAKTVVVTAESSVLGLRRPNEQFTAIFISAALFLFALFALGADAGSSLGIVSGVLDKTVAVADSIFHFVYDFALGVVIIFRSLGANFVFGSLSSLLLIAAVAFLSLIFLSRLLLRPHRA